MKTNKEAANEKAIDDACQAFREKLTRELRTNPTMFGSIAVTAQVSDGKVDRFRLSSEENQKCAAIPA